MAIGPVASPPVTAPVVRVGVLGCGNVGAALVTLIAEQRSAIEARTGLRLDVTQVAVRNLARERAVDLPPETFTTDAASVVTDPDVDVVVEVIGGIEPARSSSPRPWPTASRWSPPTRSCWPTSAPSCSRPPTRQGVDLLFEAAVAGGIPLIRPLRESLVGEPIERVMGIVNGTTNYILTRMTEEGASYADALAEAQSLGYAERDPTADVEGYDAGAKAAIIATIAFGPGSWPATSTTRASRTSRATDIAFAAPSRLRDQAAGRSASGSRRRRRRSPCGSTRRWCPTDHPLASVREQLQRRLRRGRRGRRPHVLRARARAACRPRRPCWATSSMRRSTSPG